jgi:hypothetical protein
LLCRDVDIVRGAGMSEQRVAFNDGVSGILDAMRVLDRRTYSTR